MPAGHTEVLCRYAVRFEVPAFTTQHGDRLHGDVAVSPRPTLQPATMIIWDIFSIAAALHLTLVTLLPSMFSPSILAVT
jgi:hypothetical protein